MDSVDLLAHKLMIVVGISMFVLGSIGNLVNICVFTSWSRVHRPGAHSSTTDRSSHCPLYLLVSSWANLILIVYPLLTRIMFDGYDYVLTSSNALLLCKLRYFVLHTCDLISLACICLATLDRYIISSRNVRLRSLNTTRRQSIVLLVLLIVAIGLHNSPVIVHYVVSSNGLCTIVSSAYAYYYLCVFQIVLHSLMPMLFLSVFGTLTFRHLKAIGQQTHGGQRHGDKQLSRMLVLMSIAIVLSSIPYCVEQFFYIIIYHSIDPHRSSYVFLYHVVTEVLFYMNSVSSFYIYYIATPSFRTRTQNLLQSRVRRRLRVHNRVHTLSH
jgi:hypothetical protein